MKSGRLTVQIGVQLATQEPAAHALFSEPETLPKKSAYFQSDNRLQQARKMLRRVERMHSLRSVPFSPSIAALLLLDLQEVFLHPSSHAFLPASQAVLPALVEVAQAFERIQQPIFFSRHLNTV